MSSYFERLCSQKVLFSAWEKIKSKNAPPGIDRVSCRDFEANLENNIARIRNELRAGTYKPLPVITFRRKRKTKGTRTIGIPAIRDRIVQQAILTILTPRFEQIFLPCCYAYRPGKSALHAVRHASKLIQSGNLWVLQMDVKDYFDSLDHSLLLHFLNLVLADVKLVRLISRLLKAKIFYQMGIFDHVTGTHQGSGISPLLSNVYLHPLDYTLWQSYGDTYLRYSDDITVFAGDEETLRKASEVVKSCLQKLKLSVHPGKTSINHISEGIIYLGYHLDPKGIGPSQKSVKALEERLTLYGSVKKGDIVSDKIREAKNVIRGWLSYYQNYDFSTPPNIISLIALFEILQESGKTRLARQLLKQIKEFGDVRHPELLIKIGDVFVSAGMNMQAVRQYARAMELDPENNVARKRLIDIQQAPASVHDKIKYVQLILQSNPAWRGGYEQLRDCYLEIGLFGFAEKAHNKMLALDDDPATFALDPNIGQLLMAEDRHSCFDYKQVNCEVFLSLFAGRQQAHGKQWVDEKGKWGFIRVDRPIKKRDVHKHLKGEHTLAAYPVTAADTVQYIVFDIDVAKKAILTSGENALVEFREEAHKDILRIKRVCEELGGNLYIEDSGYKGRHGWLFFNRFVSTTEAIALGQQILNLAGGPSKQMVWELYPRGKSQRPSSLIKLPLGINQKSKRWCFFLKDSGELFEDQAHYLNTIERSSWDTMITKLRNSARISKGRNSEQYLMKSTISPALAKMVSQCKVINHLIKKARETHYLTHFERVCLLYTLTFAGNDGIKLLHEVIGYCINYDRNYTQRQIDRRKESPISCAKIMEFFPELTESLACNCNFNLPPRGYPSPVLYLLESEMEEVEASFPGIGDIDETRNRVDETPSAEDIDSKEKTENGTILNFESIFLMEDSDPAKTLLDDETRSTEEEQSQKEDLTSTVKDPGVKTRCQKLPSTTTRKVVDLVQEYTRLRSQIEEADARLQVVIQQLDETFKKYGVSTIVTPIGEISWETEKGTGTRLTIRS